MSIVRMFLWLGLVAGIAATPAIADKISSSEFVFDESTEFGDIEEYPEDVYWSQMLYSPEDVYCIAEALYFEAGNQPLVGKIAVAGVILNRVDSANYPDTICGVVHQGPVRESWKKNGVFFPVKNKCQFSYYCDGRSDEPRYGPTWDDCMMVASWILEGEDWIPDHVEGATHYHAYYVNPRWASNMQLVVKIQDHIFYK